MTHVQPNGIVLPNTVDPAESIHRFELLSIATKEGIWEFDFSTRQSFYNEGMTELFGYSQEDMADNESWWRNNLHPQDKKRVITEVDEVMVGSQSVWWGKYQFRCKNGTYKLILDRLFVVRNDQQHALRLIGTMQDFTEIDALQQQLEKIRKHHRTNMMRAIFKAEENERHIISEELNENINQILAAINIHLGQAKNHINSKGLGWLQEAQGLLHDSMSGIRVIAKRLSPFVLKDLGLEYALDDLMKALEKKRTVQGYITVRREVATAASQDVQMVLYRIAQEQLLNIEKHTIATEIYIHVAATGRKISMTIQDNGMGINLKAIQYGKGFSNIQEKTEAFEGSFNLESVDGQPGFKLEVII